MAEAAPAKPSIFGGGGSPQRKGKKKQLARRRTRRAGGASASPLEEAAALHRRRPSPSATRRPRPPRIPSRPQHQHQPRPNGGARQGTRARARRSASPDDGGGRGRGRGRGKGGTSGASASPEEGRGRGRGRGKGGAKGTQRVYCVKVQPITQDVDDAKLEQLFKGTGCAPQSVRALGTYGYGNYAMRRDADAACQSLSGQDLGAGAVYCTVKEKQAPKTEAPAPAPARTGTDAPAPAQHADKVDKSACGPQPRLDTGAACRFVKGVIGGKRGATTRPGRPRLQGLRRAAPRTELASKACESRWCCFRSIEGDVGVVVFKDVMVVN